VLVRWFGLPRRWRQVVGLLAVVGALAALVTVLGIGHGDRHRALRVSAAGEVASSTTSTSTTAATTTSTAAPVFYGLPPRYPSTAGPNHPPGVGPNGALGPPPGYQPPPHNLPPGVAQSGCTIEVHPGQAPNGGFSMPYDITVRTAPGGNLTLYEEHGPHTVGSGVADSQGNLYFHYEYSFDPSTGQGGPRFHAEGTLPDGFHATCDWG
jgi:hypothetical protein